mgnify:FL=1
MDELVVEVAVRSGAKNAAGLLKATVASQSAATQTVG